MLSDRPYMRADSGRNPPSVLAWFLGLLVGVFVLQNIAELWISTRALQGLFDYGALSSVGLGHGRIWTLITYSLLHGSLTHLLLNGLGLFFVGRELQDTLGSSRFLRLLIVAALGGALAWIGIHFQRTGNVIGASGILMGLLTVYACLHPRRPMTMLLFFIIPITIQPMWLVIVLGGIDLLGLLFRELPGHGTLYGVAHSAHLGGMAAGWIFYQLVLARKMPFLAGSAPAIEAPAWFRRRASRPAVAYTVNLGSSAPPSPPRAGGQVTAREALRAEVDRILDKINLHGFGSLTAEEKHVLDEARQHLNPR